MRLLFDNNISPRVARAINALLSGTDGEAVPLRDKFPADTPDVEWIAAIGSESGWSIISGDHRITKNRAERAAWMQTNLVGFFMEPGLLKLDPLQQTARLLMWLPVLQRQIALIKGPALFALPLRSSSKLKQL